MACVYTPRGLKIRYNVEDVFIYLARVKKKFTPFSGLQLVECFVNLPSFSGVFGALVGIVLGRDWMEFLIMYLLGRLSGIIVVRQKILSRFAMRLLEPILRLYSVLCGRGIFMTIIVVLLLILKDWKASVAFVAANMILWCLEVRWLSAERGFVIAYQYMEARCRGFSDMTITIYERDNIDWRVCYSDLCAESPVLARRFDYEDSFFNRFEDGILRASKPKRTKEEKLAGIRRKYSGLSRGYEDFD